MTPPAGCGDEIPLASSSPLVRHRWVSSPSNCSSAGNPTRTTANSALPGLVTSTEPVPIPNGGSWPPLELTVGDFSRSARM